MILFNVIQELVFFLGDLLYGKEAVTTKESEMTCTCSQKRWELEQDKVMSNELVVDARKDVSLHCTQEGSYETLQCDKGRCWCVEEKTGQIFVSMSTIRVSNTHSFRRCHINCGPGISH